MKKAKDREEKNKEHELFLFNLLGCKAKKERVMALIAGSLSGRGITPNDFNHTNTKRRKLGAQTNPFSFFPMYAVDNSAII